MNIEDQSASTTHPTSILLPSRLGDLATRRGVLAIARATVVISRSIWVRIIVAAVSGLGYEHSGSLE
jgi:hypothetical protein